MNRNCIFLVVLLFSISVLSGVDIHIVNASGTIYIRADGSIDPPTAPITRNDYTYTLTDNINCSLEIQCNDVIIEGNNYTISGSGLLGSSGISLQGRRNVILMDMIISMFDYGIHLIDCSDCIVWNNTVITSNTDGICATHTSSSDFEQNNIRNSSNMGIELNLNSANNTITQNELTGNSGGIGMFDAQMNALSGNLIAQNRIGIFLQHSDHNSIFENVISQNAIGIWLFFGNGDCVWHNDFLDNGERQAFAEYSDDITWDEGYPFGGNYWSNYSLTDLYSGLFQNVTGEDDLGDTPFVISYGNLDYYPLMHRYLEDLPPKPFIVEPGQTEFVHGSHPIVWGNSTPIAAVDEYASRDIVSARFDYSIDGINWTMIGLPLFADSEYAGNTTEYLIGGPSYWRIVWNGTLSEGHYYIKVTMTDNSGQVGSTQEQVYFESEPPVPVFLYPDEYTTVKGKIKLVAGSLAEDIDYVDFGVYNETFKTEQTGYDPFDGKELGGSDLAGSSCAPIAVTTALLRLAKAQKVKEGMLKIKDENKKKLIEQALKDYGLDKQQPKPEVLDKEGNLTPLGLALLLAKIFGTDTAHGTTYDEIQGKVREFLNEQGYGCNNKDDGYEIEYISLHFAGQTQDRFIFKLNGKPIEVEKGGKIPYTSIWDFCKKQMEAGESVFFEYFSDDKPNGHTVVLQKMEVVNRDGKDVKVVKYIDSDGKVKEMDWPEDLKDGLPPGEKYREKDQPTYLGESRIRAAWAISPKNKKRDLPQDTKQTWLPLGRDYLASIPSTLTASQPQILAVSRSGNWSVEWDTTVFEDGLHAITAEMADSMGNVGTTMIIVNVDNHPFDVNKDRKVDIVDVAMETAAFGSYPGHPRWSSVLDMNQDGRIDIMDVAIVVSKFGTTY